MNKQRDYYSSDIQKNARKSARYDDVTRNLTKCPFCDLKAKYFVKELSGSVLTMNLFPYIDGHMMIIPKRHVESFELLNNKEWSEFKKLIDVGIKLIKSELGIENTNTLYRQGGKNSGASLGHLHVHLLPITAGFMTYEKQRFIYNFLDVKHTPIEMAERLRKACQKLK